MLLFLKFFNVTCHKYICIYFIKSPCVAQVTSKRPTACDSAMSDYKMATANYFGVKTGENKKWPTTITFIGRVIHVCALSTVTHCNIINRQLALPDCNILSFPSEIFR